MKRRRGHKRWEGEREEERLKKNEREMRGRREEAKKITENGGREMEPSEEEGRGKLIKVIEVLHISQ